MPKIYNIVLVEDYSLQLEGLKFIIEMNPHFKVIASYSNATDFLNSDYLSRADLILTDVHMPDIDGIELTKLIKQQNSEYKVALLTMQRGPRYLQRAEKIKANGYILKNKTSEELHDILLKICKGETYYDTNPTTFTQEDDLHIKSTLTINDTPESILSDREKEILILVCKEYSSAQIAEKLFISVGTVDTHRKNILIKLGVNNTVGLVKYAIKYGLINQ